MKNCLIIDDNAMDRLMIRTIVESLGFNVSEAAEAYTALEFCVWQMPDYIILDWVMPGTDGIEFLMELRALPGGDKPRVMMCTSQDDSDANRKLARAAGANFFVTKPLNSKKLLSAFSLAVFAA